MKITLIKVRIMERAYYKLNTYFRLAKGEVGGLLEVDIKQNDILVKDAVLLEQEVSGGDFKLDKNDLAKFTKTLFTQSPEKMTSYRAWFHCHPITGWSGTDNNTFERLGEIFKGSIFGLVKQSDGKFLCRLDLFNNKTDLTFNTLNFEIVPEVFDKKKVKKECEKLYKQKVKERTYTYSGPSSGIINGKPSWVDDWYKGQSLYNAFSNGTPGVIKSGVYEKEVIRDYATKTLREEITADVIGRINLELKWNETKLRECKKLNSCGVCPFIDFCLGFENTQKMKQLEKIADGEQDLWGCFYD